MPNLFMVTVSKITNVVQRNEGELNIEILYRRCMRLDEIFARLNDLAHQNVKELIRLNRVANRNPFQHSYGGIHRRLPKLRRIHLP